MACDCGPFQDRTDCALTFLGQQSYSDADAGLSTHTATFSGYIPDIPALPATTTTTPGASAAIEIVDGYDLDPDGHHPGQEFEAESTAFFDNVHVAPTGATIARLLTTVKPNGSYVTGDEVLLHWVITSNAVTVAHGALRPVFGSDADPVDVTLPVIAGKVNINMTYAAGGDGSGELPQVNVNGGIGPATRWPNFNLSDISSDDVVFLGGTDTYLLNFYSQPCNGGQYDGIVIDDFNRSASGQWGLASGIPITWDLIDASAFITGNEAYIALSTGVTSNSEFNNLVLAGQSYNDITVTATVTVDTGGPVATRGAVLGGDGPTDSVYLLLATDNSLNLTTNAGTVSTVLGFDGPRLPTHLRFLIHGGVIYAKGWEDGTAEPGWLLSQSFGDRFLTTDLYLGVEGGFPFTDDITAKFDDLRTGPHPGPNQPVLDEQVGIGDGSTVIFYTRFPYVTNTLLAQVGGVLSDVDPTDPSQGQMTFLDPPPLGAPVTVTYEAA